MLSDRRHWRESPARDELVPDGKKLSQPSSEDDGALRSSPPRATERRVTVVAPTTVLASSRS